MGHLDIPSDHGFAPAVLRGLLALGPVDRRQGDLTLELGISLWLRRSRTSVVDALVIMMAARDALVGAAGLDPETEPIPLFGRSPKSDLVNLAVYLSHLIERAAGTAHCRAPVMVERAIECVADVTSTHTATTRVAG